MSGYKRQHVVPEMLLKNFSFRKNGRKRLYSFDKDSSGKGIRETSPHSFCVEDDIYTRYEEDGNRDVSAEKDYSNLEARTGPIIKKIMKATRTNKYPQLSCDERRTLGHFISVKLFDFFPQKQYIDTVSSAMRRRSIRSRGGWFVAASAFLDALVVSFHIGVAFLSQPPDSVFSFGYVCGLSSQ